ncbi:MAG: hypothetical protein EBR99_08150, partial [Actinobacteria bacterium]|nr:hypothetical protein [Actinomycetota bacterium]
MRLRRILITTGMAATLLLPSIAGAKATTTTTLPACQQFPKAGGVYRNCTWSGATFAGFNLTSTNLTGTNLSNADLSSAILIGTNLTGTDLSGAKLDGVISRGIVGKPSALPPLWAVSQ